MKEKRRQFQNKKKNINYPESFFYCLYSNHLTSQSPCENQNLILYNLFVVFVSWFNDLRKWLLVAWYVFPTKDGVVCYCPYFSQKFSYYIQYQNFIFYCLKNVLYRSSIHKLKSHLSLKLYLRN